MSHFQYLLIIVSALTNPKFQFIRSGNFSHRIQHKIKFYFNYDTFSARDITSCLLFIVFRSFSSQTRDLAKYNFCSVMSKKYFEFYSVHVRKKCSLQYV